MFWHRKDYIVVKTCDLAYPDFAELVEEAESEEIDKRGEKQAWKNDGCEIDYR
jgi:hypothetical protein